MFLGFSLPVKHVNMSTSSIFSGMSSSGSSVRSACNMLSPNKARLVPKPLGFQGKEGAWNLSLISSRVKSYLIY